jgi:N-acetylgalactosamine-6-sulfatase
LPKGYQPDGESIVKALKGEEFIRNRPIYWNWHFSNNRPEFWPSAGIQDENWKLLTNQTLGKTELYNINTDWAEQKDISMEYPEKVESLLAKINDFEKSLPKFPNENCFSKERLALKN